MARKKSEDIEMFHGADIYVPTRRMYIGSQSSADAYVEHGSESGVDHNMAERAIKNLHVLDSISNEEITIIMNNVGGDVVNGMAIYDAIKQCKSPITIEASGNVCSMGSLIFQAANKRVMSKHAVMMLHHGEESKSGHVKIVRNWVDFGKKYDKILNGIYLEKIREKKPDFNMKKLDKLLNFDTILLAEEAIELGLADDVKAYYE